MADKFNFAKVVPEWMNQDFFDKVIRHMENDPQAKVEKFEVTAGSKPGDNFASSLFRGVVNYRSKFTKNESKKISLILKIQMMSGEVEMVSDMLKESPLFRNEMEMYGKILPIIQELWTMIGDDELLCPKMIYQSTEPVPLIILEDLSVHGFGVIDKPIEDIETSKDIFRRLAKFHASSFYLFDENKLNYDNFQSSIFENPMLLDMMFNQGLDAFTTVAKEHEDFERYIPKLEAFRQSFLQRALETYSTKGHAYNVLSHGDFHTKNLLFKKNAEDKIEKFYFIDFQICVHASPAIDLIYALYFMVSPQNRLNHRDELIAIYHQQLSDSLKSFGYLKSPPSLVDVHVEMLRNGHLEVLIAICLAIFFYIDFSQISEEAVAFDVPEAVQKAKQDMYRIPEFLEIMKKELPAFLYKGFI